MRHLAASILGVAALVGISAQSATAADMPTKAVPYVAAYNWTGLYVGGHIGGAWSNGAVGDPSGTLIALGTTLSDNGSGFLGGGQFGYNYQTGSWVFGVQGDVSWTGINATATSTLVPAATINEKANWLATFNGRVGYAWNTWLLYGKGGVAWVHNSYTATNTGTSTGSDTRAGYLVGGGLEYAFSRNWSAFAEYDFIGLGTHTLNLNPVPGTGQPTFNQNLNLVKVGVNYKF